MIDKWGAAAKAKRAVHPDKGGGVFRSILRLSTTADVESTDPPQGPEPTKVGTGMDERIGMVSASAARATARGGADDAATRIGGGGGAGSHDGTRRWHASQGAGHLRL